MALRTEYEFILPRGYLDEDGAVHNRGTMRLATARDELEPLRSTLVTGPDDPRVTILVLARVVQRLGTLELVTADEIEGLFAADLAYLQDFYGIINFGTEEEINALLDAQHAAELADAGKARSEPGPATSAPSTTMRGEDTSDVFREQPASRRAAIEEVPGSGR
jgi:hypothetical protein